MSISSTTYRAQYTSTGTTGPYPFTFPIVTGGITVIITDTSGNETDLPSTAYSLYYTNNNPQDGGAVTLNTAVQSGYTVTILRNTPQTQQEAFYNGQPTLYESFQASVDQLTMEVQDLQGEINRVPMLKGSTQFGPLALPDPQPGYYLAWNSLGTQLQNNPNPLPGTSVTVTTIKYLSGYASLAAALTAIGTTPTTLICDIGVSITSNTTIPSNVELIATIMGGFNVSTGVILTINGPFSAGSYQVFTGSGNVTGLKYAIPQWFSSVNGTIDNTQAINSAVLAASGGEVHFPAANYVISVSINIPSNTNITGEGMSSKITNIAGSTNNGINMFYSKDTTGIGISGVWLQNSGFGNSTTPPTSTLAGYGANISLLGVNRSIVKNVYLSGFGNGGGDIAPGIYLSRCQDGIVSNNTVFDGQNGINIDDYYSGTTQNTHNIVVSNNNISNLAGRGIILDLNNEDSNITVTSNVLRQIAFNAFDLYMASGFIVTGNTVDGDYIGRTQSASTSYIGAGIYLRYCSDFDISHNVFNKMVNSVYGQYNSQGSIDNNKFITITGYGILNQFATGYLPNYLKIRSNTFIFDPSSTESYCIALQAQAGSLSVYGVDINNNDMVGLYGDGIELDTTGGTSWYQLNVNNNTINWLNSRWFAAYGINAGGIQNGNINGNNVIRAGGGVQLVGSNGVNILDNIFDTCNAGVIAAAYPVYNLNIKSTFIYGTGAVAIVGIVPTQPMTGNANGSNFINYPPAGFKSASSVAITYYGTAAPTTGYWSAGDRILNSAGAGTWVCNVSGTPGTWVSGY